MDRKTPASQSGRRPGSLLDLPDEVIGQVASHFDRRSALAFARVARRLLAFSEKAIWKHLDLTLPPGHSNSHTPPPDPIPKAPSFYGNYPPRALSDEEQLRLNHQWWAGGKAQDAERVRRETLERQAHNILLRGGQRHWKFVESIHLEVRSKAMYRIAAVLDFAAPLLLRLTTSLPYEQWETFAHDTLDYHLYHRRIIFPSLTHLVIETGSIQCPGTIPVIYEAAANLEYLDIEIGGREFIDSRLGMVYHGPDEDWRTKIRYLRYKFGIYGDEDEDERWEATRALGDLLSCSPHLEWLGIDGVEWGSRASRLVWRAAGKVQSLHRLRWIIPVEGFCHNLANIEGVSFASLTVLILRFGTLVDIFEKIPALPQLEELHLDLSGLDEYDQGPEGQCPAHVPDSGTFPPIIDTARAMWPMFAAVLRAAPRSRRLYCYVNYDDFGAYLTEPKSECQFCNRFDCNSIECCRIQGDITASFASYHHGEQELLYARYEMPYREIGDIEETIDETEYEDKQGIVPVWYSPRDEEWGNERIKGLARTAENVTHIFTDLDGVVVPLEVISRMLAVQSMKSESIVTETELKGRGTEIGAEAWKVVTDWLDRDTSADVA